MKRYLLSLFLAVGAASGAAAQDRYAPLPEWEGALLSGSQRLMLFSLLKTQPRGSLSTQKLLAERLGLFHRPEDGLKAGDPWFSASPILEYDDNVNNGVPGRTFVVNGFEYDVDEHTRAKGAIVMGARLGTGVSVTYGQGSTLDFSVSSTFRHAPSEDITRTAYRASVCGNEYMSNWTWLTMCAGYKYDESRDTGDIVEGRFASVGVRKLFSSPIGSHEATAAITKDALTNYSRYSTNVGVISALRGGVLLGVGLSLGEEVAGYNSVLRSVSVNAARTMWDETMRLSLTYHETGGQQFFGTAREDGVYSVSVSRRITGRLTVGVGARKVASSVDVYDETRFSLDVSFSGWSF